MKTYIFLLFFSIFCVKIASFDEGLHNETILFMRKILRLEFVILFGYGVWKLLSDFLSSTSSSSDDETEDLEDLDELDAELSDDSTSPSTTSTSRQTSRYSQRKNTSRRKRKTSESEQVPSIKPGAPIRKRSGSFEENRTPKKRLAFSTWHEMYEVDYWIERVWDTWSNRLRQQGWTEYQINGDEPDDPPPRRSSGKSPPWR